MDKMITVSSFKHITAKIGKQAMETGNPIYILPSSRKHHSSLSQQSDGSDSEKNGEVAPSSQKKKSRQAEKASSDQKEPEMEPRSCKKLCIALDLGGSDFFNVQRGKRVLKFLKQMKVQEVRFLHVDAKFAKKGNRHELQNEDIRQHRIKEKRSEMKDYCSDFVQTCHAEIRPKIIFKYDSIISPELYGTILEFSKRKNVKCLCLLRRKRGVLEFHKSTSKQLLPISKIPILLFLQRKKSD